MAGLKSLILQRSSEMFALIKKVFTAVFLISALSSCNIGSNSTTSNTVSGNTNSAAIGALPNDSVIVSSLGTFNLPPDSSIRGTVAIVDGLPGYTGALTLSIRSNNLDNQALPVVTTEPNPCILTSGSSDQSSCQVKVSNHNGAGAAPDNSYIITPTFTPFSGAVSILSDMSIQAAAKAKVVAGSLSIVPASSTITQGNTITAIVTLSGSTGVTSLPVTVTSTNVTSSASKILSVTPASCTLNSTTKTTCQVIVSGLESGVASISASASGYTTASSNHISVNPKAVPGNLSVSLSKASLTAGESTTAKISLVGSSNVTGIVASISSGNTSLAVVNKNSCTLSSAQNSCNVIVTAVSNVSNNSTTTINATSNGYTAAQSTLSITPVPVAGTLSIALASTNINIGGSTKATVTLSGSKSISGVNVEFSSGNTNNAIISSNPPSCTVSSASPTCSVNISAESTGTSVINATASNYQSTQITLKISPQPIPGTLTLALSNAFLSYGQSESATVTLTGSSGVSNLAVNIASANTALAKVSPASCVLSSATNNCLITITSGTTTSGSTSITATANGYTSAQRALAVSSTLPQPTESAYMQVYVSPNLNGTTCNYENAPCVTLTICNPTTPSNCVTVNNILIDSGSYGLRIFSSLLSSLNLPVEKNGNNTVAECVSYADNTSNWGPVASANIILSSSGITASAVPIQLLNSSYTGAAASCPGSVATPAQFGLNGILGVGPLINDEGEYFACNNSSCSAINLSSINQVSNPIGLLPNSQYNNGITIKFPYVPSSGSSGTIGYAIFGVGTDSDNAVTPAVNKYPISLGGNIPVVMPTIFNNTSLNGFLDTGSNGLFFNDSGIATCDGGWFCPTSTISLSAKNKNASNSWITTNFNIENANTLFNTGNGPLPGLGAPFMAGYFDYGLPFFYGNTVYIGFVGMTSPAMGTGPYWGF